MKANFMINKIRQASLYLAGILSKLELPPETGRVWGFEIVAPGGLSRLGMAIQFAKVSAKCFGESVHFLGLAARYLGYCLGNLSRGLRLRLLAAFWMALRSRGHSLRYSCQQENDQSRTESSHELPKLPKLPKPHYGSTTAKTAPPFRGAGVGSGSSTDTEQAT